MRDRGYIYTLLTVVMVMMILSLVFFHFRITKPRVEDTITSIRTDELYYLVNAMKEDYKRSSFISAQRAVLYAQDYVIENQQGLAGYAFNSPNCGFSGDGLEPGSESAIAEMMLCGTLSGATSDVMSNHTIDVWIDRSTARARNLGFNMSINLTDFDILPFGAFNFLVLTDVNISGADRVGNPVVYGNFTADAVVSIEGFADPLYYLYTGDQGLIRKFSACNQTHFQYNSSYLRELMDDECYLASSFSYDSPSFFDRLDGRLSHAVSYRDQAKQVSALLNNPELNDTGIESVINLHDWIFWYNVSVNKSASWVDYRQWNNITGDCGMDLGDAYSGFLLDSAHALKYYLDAPTCRVGAYSSAFSPDYLSVPVKSTVRWTNQDASENHTIIWQSPADSWCFGAGTKIEGLGSYKECDFADKGWAYGNTYTYDCLRAGHSHTGSVHVSEPVGSTNAINVCDVNYYCGVLSDGVCVRDFGLECSCSEDPDCCPDVPVARPPFYADGGAVPKHVFSGAVSAPDGTLVGVISDTGDLWLTQVSAGSYGIDITFDNVTTGFDEGTSNGAQLTFVVAGGPVAEPVQTASIGQATDLPLTVDSGACVSGAACSPGCTTVAWDAFGVGLDKVGSTNNGLFYDVACCSNVVRQL